MDGGSSLNLLYQDIVRKMGIEPSRIKPTKPTFKGVIPGVGNITTRRKPAYLGRVNFISGISR